MLSSSRRVLWEISEDAGGRRRVVYSEAKGVAKSNHTAAGKAAGLVGSVCFCRCGHFWQDVLASRCLFDGVWSESGEFELDALVRLQCEWGFNADARGVVFQVSRPHAASCPCTPGCGPCSCGAVRWCVRVIRDGAVVGSTGLRHDLGGAGVYMWQAGRV